MESKTESRRWFLKQASMALALPFVLNCPGGIAAADADGSLLEAIKRNAIQNPAGDWWGAKDAPADVSSKTALATPQDEGERIKIHGTIYTPDGKTPAPNVLIYLYHTDVHGIYGRRGEHRHGKYRGWMLTDSRGRFEFDTILPASYPDSTIAKHIHMTVTGKDFREDWIDSILFEGDRFITARERVPQKGGFNPVLTLDKGRDGILRGVRNIILPA